MFGISFGGSKEKTKSTTDGTKFEVGTQQGISDTNSTTLGDSKTQGTSNTSSSGSSTTTQSGSTVSQGSSTTQQTGVSKLFDDNVLSSLGSAVTNLLGSGGNSTAQSVIDSGLTAAGNFDPAKFIADTVAAAQAKSDTATGISLGGIADVVGGKNNSASALLGQQVNNDAIANIAGIRAGATSTAQGLLNNTVQTATQAQAGSQGLLANLLNALKGGSATTSASAATNTAEQQQTQQAGTTNTSEQSATNTTQNQQTVQLLSQVLSQLLNTTDSTTAHQTTTGSGGKLEAGFKMEA